MKFYIRSYVYPLYIRIIKIIIKEIFIRFLSIWKFALFENLAKLDSKTNLIMLQTSDLLISTIKFVKCIQSYYINFFVKYLI